MPLRPARSGVASGFGLLSRAAVASAWCLAAALLVSGCPRGGLQEVVPAPLACAQAPAASDSPITSPEGNAVAVYRPSGACASSLSVTFPSEGVVRWASAPAGPDCSWELAAFSRFQGMLLLTPVSGGSDAPMTRDEPLAPTLRVPVRAWVYSGGDDVAQDLRVDLTLASLMLELNRVGVVLDLVESVTVLPASHDPRIDEGCTSIAAWANAGHPYYAPDTLNVYAGLDIVGWGNAGGLSCFGSYARPNVIFVAFDLTKHKHWALAHEVGHALGLQGSCGHTNGGPCGGFDSRNLMWDAAPDAGRSLFSLGQAYRMNVADSSWVNLVGLRRGLPVKTCQRCWQWNDPSACCVRSPCMQLNQQCPATSP